MIDHLKDRRTAEVVHKRYHDLMTQEDALKALAACGAPADADRLDAAVEAYDEFTCSLAAILQPAMATEGRAHRPPLTQTPAPVRRLGHNF